MSVRVGDYVRISMPLHGRYCLGNVTKIDGGYVYIKLNYKGIVVERLLSEIRENK